MDFKTLSSRIYLYGIAIAAILAIFFYFFIGTEARSSVSSQILAEQKVINRAEANNISSFFTSLGNSITILANVDSVKKADVTKEPDIDIFVKNTAPGILGGVILTDSEGNVIYNSNTIGTNDSGISVGDRDYFLWAKEQTDEGKYFVGKPVISRLGASEGQNIVVVASPVFNGSVFKGLVGTSVELQSLTQRYLELMKVSDMTDVYLTDETGQILYSNFDPGTVGSNIVGISPEFKNAVGINKEGSFSASYSDSNNDNSATHDVVYSPVNVGSQKWTLIMASPVGDIWGTNIPMYIRVIVFLVFTLVSMFFFGSVAIKEVGKSNNQISSETNSSQKEPK